MQVIHFDPITVSPPEPQDVRTPEFEMRGAGTHVVVRAGGVINSGALLTGDTPPTGWEEMLATADDRDWPYRGTQDAFRYCLIGRFERQNVASNWFYIGSGRTFVGNGRVSGPGVRLRLAVNRPHIDQRAAGGNRWTVHVDIHQLEAGETPPPRPQEDWRYCRKCQGLAFLGQGLGRCPADGEHDFSESGRYTLVRDGAGQGDWRWCRKCQGLFFHGNNSFGRCPAGGRHATDALALSGNYSLVQEGSGQNGWRYCNKCEGLYFAGNGSHGRCPGGDAHAEEGTGDYVLTVH